MAPSYRADSGQVTCAGLCPPARGLALLTPYQASIVRAQGPDAERPRAATGHAQE